MRRCSGIKENKDKYRADSVILALGSLSGAKSTMSTGDGYYICKQLGMGFKDTYPALVGFKCEAGDVMPDAGVRAGARISFFLGDELITSESGELQISKDGISGIPVMQASREVIKFVTEKKPIVASADFFPDYDDADFEALKSDMLKLRDDRTLEEFLLGFANSNINDMVLKKNMEKGLIEVAPLAYMRGRTLDNAFIILDEAQNTTPAQMKMFLLSLLFSSRLRMVLKEKSFILFIERGAMTYHVRQVRM